MKCNRVLYEELLPEQFAARIQEVPIAYLPLGTLEWHSFHLPLGADGLQSQGVFKKIAERVGGIVLPMLFLGPDSKTQIDDQYYYGMDGYSFEEGHEQQLAGSAYYVQEELFIQILETIIQNLVRAGFKMIIAHGHGPSTHLFEEKKEYFEKKYNIETSTLWNLGIPGDDGIQTDHAATNETILTMALHPDLVDLDKLPKDDVPVSVWGPDPRKFASVEYGEKVIYDNVDVICQRLIPIIEKLTKPVINLNYHHVKNMLRDKNEN